MLFVLFDDHLHEVFVISSKGFSVLLEVQDGSGLRLYLIYISVDNSSNFILSNSLGLLSGSLLFLSGLLGNLLGLSELWSDTKLVVTSVLLPELLEWLSIKLRELKLNIFNLELLGEHFIKKGLSEFMLRNGNFSSNFIRSHISNLDLWVFDLVEFDQSFPVDLEALWW